MKTVTIVLVAGLAVVSTVLLLGLLGYRAIVREYLQLDPMVVFLLAMALIALLLFRVVFPAVMYRVSSAELASGESAVRHSGLPLATIVCGGRVGGVGFRGPLLRAAVHPGGLVIRPLFLAPFGLATADITGVRIRREWWAWGLEINHASRQVRSPILLGCAEPSAFVAALRSIVPATADEPAAADGPAR